MIAYISLCIASGLTAMLICLYFWKQGQFDEIEETKYQLFRDEPPEE